MATSDRDGADSRNGGWTCPECNEPAIYGQGLIWRDGELWHQQCLVVDKPESRDGAAEERTMDEQIPEEGSALYAIWRCGFHWGERDPVAFASAIVREIEAAGYRVVPVWTLVDALADAIAECTNQGWDDPGSVTWRRAMAAGKKTLGVTIPGDVDTPS